MTSTFFTTNDGDIVLRTGTEPDSKHDFRVHKFILSLASSVFKNMFTFPQPPGQTLNAQHQLPIVDIPDSPKVLDMILRFIYPGVEPPKITEPQALSALLLTADKYNITSIYPALRANLKTFLPSYSLWAYIIACRFGFLEETKQAAKLMTSNGFLCFRNREDIQLISSTDLFRLVQFVQERECDGRIRIESHLDPLYLENITSCEHGEKDAQDYYSHLEKEVERAFVTDPCVGSKDLFAVLDRIPDPPPGCDPLPRSGGWYCGAEDQDAFQCPLQPMTIRRKLADIAEGLRLHNDELLQRFFGRGTGIF